MDNNEDFKNLDEKHKNILINDQIDEFIEDFTFFDFNTFVMACKYNSIKITKYCIEINFCLDHITNKRQTAFTFLFTNNNIEIIRILINKLPNAKSLILIKDYYHKNAMFYSSDSIMNQIKIEILNINDERDVKYDDFRIYNFDEFNPISYDKDKKGAYGTVKHFVEKSTGKNVIIKSIKNKGNYCENNFRSFLKEISLMKSINQLNNQIVAQIYGVILLENEIYMVQEYFENTLQDILHILKDVDIEHKRNYVKNFMKNLLLIVDTLSSFGIIHFDLNPDNIIVDRNNRLKLIDFGISQYIGFNSLKEFRKCYFDPRYVMPPDGIDTVKLKTGSNSEIITFQSHEITFNHDIFSIGIIFTNFIYSYINNLFSMGNRIFFSGDFDEPYQDNKFWYQLSKRKIIEFGGEDFESLLLQMLNCDSNLRPTAKKCLNHRYFTDNEIIESNNIITIKNNIKNRFIFNSYNMNLSSDFEYFENIHSNYLDIKLLETNFNLSESKNVNKQMFYILIDWILDVAIKNESFSLDVIINTINRIYVFMYNEKDMKRNKLQGYGIVIFYLTHTQYCLRDFKLSKIEEYCAYQYSESEIQSFARDILKYNFMYSITPIETHISYLLIKLDQNNFVKSENLENFIIKNLIFWTLFNMKEQCTVWNLIINIASIYFENNNIYFDFDQDKIIRNDIKEMISDNKDFKFSEKISSTINQLY